MKKLTKNSLELHGSAADLVILDLARWEDWEVISKLCDLFIKADENSSWVRVPVVNYLRACPLPLAKEKIEQLKLVDADAVKRAMMFFPLTSDKKKEDEPPSKSEEKETKKEDLIEEVSEVKKPTQEGALTAQFISTSSADPMPVIPAPPSTTEPSTVVHATVGKAGAKKNSTVAQASTSSALKEARAMATSTTSITTPETLNQAELLVDRNQTNRWLPIGVATIAGGVCFVLMRTIMGVGIN